MPVVMSQLTEDEFALFAKLVHERAGIHVSLAKRALLSNRLRRRLRRLNLGGFDEYYRKFSNAAFANEELPHFLSAVTTNETYFFRNEKLWETLSNKLVPEFIAAHSARDRRIKVWSAASSSGEEAYSAAILLRESLHDIDKWSITVVATDISRKVLDHAQKGLYGEYALAQMSTLRRTRWFRKVDDKFQLKDEIRRMVRFTFHNLREPFAMNGFDLVLLRNVLMYFDMPMKLRAIDTACKAVAAGGYLFVGDVDPIRSTSELRDAMKLSPDRPGFYRKPPKTSRHAKT